MDSNGINWSWVAQVLFLIVIVTLVASFAISIINNTIHRVIQTWKKDNEDS